MVLTVALQASDEHVRDALKWHNQCKGPEGKDYSQGPATTAQCEAESYVTASQTPPRCLKEDT